MSNPTFVTTEVTPKPKSKPAKEWQAWVSNLPRHSDFAHIAHNPLQNLVHCFSDFSQTIANEFERSENFWDGVGRVGGIALQNGKRLLVGEKKSIDVRVSSWELLQGETLAIVMSESPSRRGIFETLASVFGKALPPAVPSIRVSFGGSEVPAFPRISDTRTWRTFIPSTPLHQPGPSSLTVELNDGRHRDFHGVVVVCHKDYPVESIWLSDTKSKIQGTQKEKDAVKALTLMATSVQHWSGPFILPSEGRITTAYGVQRYYNGKFANGYYHRGIDYGVAEGSPVRAPSTGRVALVGREAEGFEIHGNCVGLDHGHGVTSILMHLSSTCVKEGDIVENGQVVGLVGQTGLATGPHLHWGFYVHGEAVDPHNWMKEQPWL